MCDERKPVNFMLSMKPRISMIKAKLTEYPTKLGEDGDINFKDGIRNVTAHK